RARTSGPRRDVRPSRAAGAPVRARPGGAPGDVQELPQPEARAGHHQGGLRPSSRGPGPPRSGGRGGRGRRRSRGPAHHRRGRAVAAPRRGRGAPGPVRPQRAGRHARLGAARGARRRRRPHRAARPLPGGPALRRRRRRRRGRDGAAPSRSRTARLSRTPRPPDPARPSRPGRTPEADGIVAVRGRRDGPHPIRDDPRSGVHHDRIVTRVARGTRERRRWRRGGRETPPARTPPFPPKPALPAPVLGTGAPAKIGSTARRGPHTVATTDAFEEPSHAGRPGRVRVSPPLVFAAALLAAVTAAGCGAGDGGGKGGRPSSAPSGAPSSQTSPSREPDAWIPGHVAKMSLADKVGQLFVPTFSSRADAVEKIRKYRVG